MATGAPNLRDRGSSATSQLPHESEKRVVENGWLRRTYRGENAGILFGVLILTLLVFQVTIHRADFLSYSNLSTVVRLQVTIVIMSIATVFVISAGEIDLSFAAVIPVAGYVAALMLPHYGVPLAIAGALGVGVATGLLNGLVTVLLRLPSFIVTLGTMSILGGAALWVTNSQPVPVTNRTYQAIFGNHKLWIVPVPIIWTLAALALGFLILNFTPAGKAVLATGANMTVAKLSGIRTSRVRVAVMVGSSVSGAVAGLLYDGLLGAAQYDLGSSDLLIVLAATIIGGTALAGGKGSVGGALLGALLLGFLTDGLILLGLGIPEQMVLQGVVIIVAIAVGARPKGKHAGR